MCDCVYFIVFFRCCPLFIMLDKETPLVSLVECSQLVIHNNVKIKTHLHELTDGPLCMRQMTCFYTFLTLTVKLIFYKSFYLTRYSWIPPFCYCAMVMYLIFVLHLYLFALFTCCCHSSLILFGLSIYAILTAVLQCLPFFTQVFLYCS